MLKEIISEMTEKQLKVLIENMVEICDKDCPETIQKAVMETYYELFGYHFTPSLLKIATSKMRNEDGSHGGRWTVEETNSVAKSYGVAFDHFNECDWNYAMNMVYSDFYGAVQNDTSSYVKLAHKFLCDKDGSDGKAIKYFFAMAEL